MNSQNFILSIISGILCAIICAFGRYCYQIIKNNSNPPNTENTNPLKNILHLQFLISLTVFFLAWPTSFILDDSLLKIICFVISGFSLLIIDGTFEKAFAYYPDDNSISNEPAE